MSTPETTTESVGGGGATSSAQTAPPKGPPTGKAAKVRSARFSNRMQAIEQLAALVAGRRVDRREDGQPQSKSAWLISGAFNLAIMITAICILIKAAEGNGEKERSIIIPQSFEDPSLSEHPGGVPHAGAGDPMKDAMQNLQQIIKNEGWSQAEDPHSVSELLGASTSDAVEGIFRGAGGSMGEAPGTDTAGKVAAFGATGGGAGVGPKSSFYGTGGNAERIVYLIDRTGSLTNDFGGSNEAPRGTVKGEVYRSISALVPLQLFSVVVFTGADDGGAQVLGPPNLVRATPDNKTMIVNLLKVKVAEGGNSDEDYIFVQAFRKAIDLKPQLIYFLTDGNVSPEVKVALRKMNADHVIINALMFTETSVGKLEPGDAARFAILSDLAKENGGSAKPVFSGQ